MTGKQIVISLLIAVAAVVIGVHYEDWFKRTNKGEGTPKKMEPAVDSREDIFEKATEFSNLIENIENDNFSENERKNISLRLESYMKELQDYYSKTEDCKIGKTLMSFYKMYSNKLKGAGDFQNSQNFENHYKKILNKCN